MSFPLFAFAEIAGFPFESETEEQRFRELSAELRCLVCQNQSLADSNADLALDLRTELYEQVKSGNSNSEIIGFMTERYGDFILYKPRFSGKTWLLWLTPFLLLLFAVVGLIYFGSKRRQETSEQVSEEELKKVRALLDDEADK